MDVTVEDEDDRARLVAEAPRFAPGVDERERGSGVADDDRAVRHGE